MYAIIETGGKQYCITPGEVLSVEKLNAKQGEKVTFDKILLVGGKSEHPTLVGAPYLPQALAEAEVVAQTRGDKIRIIKYRRRKGYRKTQGHRQSITRLLVTKVEDGQGGKLEFDSTKRKEVLQKASISTNT